MRQFAPLLLVLFVFPNPASSQSVHSLTALATDFWQWRAIDQPLSGDDIPRIERPGGWLPDWSAAAVEDARGTLRHFESRYSDIDTSGWVIANQVDYRLVGSALARVNWELNITASWQRNPIFYIDQTQGLVFEALLPPGNLDSTRTADLIARFQNIPSTVQHGIENLNAVVPEFARLALRELATAPGRFRNVLDALKLYVDPYQYGNLLEAGSEAITALERYRSFLEDNLATMSGTPAIGRDQYRYFLHQVALLPFEPEELVAVAHAEWERSVAFEALQRQRNSRVPELTFFDDQQEQVDVNAMFEDYVRYFLEDNGILSVPDWLMHYGNRPVPDYLLPLAHHGVIDDLTAASRLDRNAVKYIRRPSEGLPYFGRATAQDVRPLLVHEGIPGHYFQLALSWAHENPIRRHYYDSGANEGIGFYAEEMMLQQGFFDDSPRTREIIYNFMRLRALRVEVDVKLATGQFSIEEAARYLAETVPMDATTASEEAAFFASTPGQAISYQIGKSQILSFLAASRMKAPQITLRTFHDYLWTNGNVPIALLQWEFLSDDTQIRRLDAYSSN